MRNGRVATGVVLVSLIGLGCATGRGMGPQISDEWVARVPQAQLGPVYDARSHLRQASDELVRARLVVEDAERDLQVQRSLLGAERSRVDAAKKALEAARHTGDAARISEAERRLEFAHATRDLAERRMDLEAARVRAAQAQHQVEQARLERAQVEVERAEFLVLQDHGDTRVGEFSLADFDRPLAELRERQRKLERRLAKHRDQMAGVQREIEGLERRLGIGGAGRTR
jgi:colicin import membrane protein